MPYKRLIGLRSYDGRKIHTVVENNGISINPKGLINFVEEAPQETDLAPGGRSPM
jgi:hypothetical protein